MCYAEKVKEKQALAFSGSLAFLGNSDIRYASTTSYYIVLWQNVYAVKYISY